MRLPPKNPGNCSLWRVPGIAALWGAKYSSQDSLSEAMGFKCVVWMQTLLFGFCLTGWLKTLLRKYHRILWPSVPHDKTVSCDMRRTIVLAGLPPSKGRRRHFLVRISKQTGTQKTGPHEVPADLLTEITPHICLLSVVYSCFRRHKEEHRNRGRRTNRRKMKLGWWWGRHLIPIGHVHAAVPYGHIHTIDLKHTPLPQRILGTVVCPHWGAIFSTLNKLHFPVFFGGSHELSHVLDVPLAKACPAGCIWCVLIVWVTVRHYAMWASILALSDIYFKYCAESAQRGFSYTFETSKLKEYSKNY